MPVSGARRVSPVSFRARRGGASAKMGHMRLAALFCLATAAWGQSLPEILSRVSEEAEVFREVAPQVLAEETLTQRAVKPPGRFRLRVGAAATKPEAPVMHTRQIVSEYSFGAFGKTEGPLHEFREVISVDGRRVGSREAARHSLALGLNSSDDRAKKRMLEQFQKYGLRNAAVDFGPLLLLFTKQQMGNYHFKLLGTERIGADQVRLVEYKQVSGPDRMMIVQGRQAIHQPIEGSIYARMPDGLPLRITITESREEAKHKFRDEATVDYVPNAHGFLAPAAVTHREYGDGALIVDDEFRYTPFKKFGANADIRFDTSPEAVK
jgi:hypothetical protein